MNSKLETEVMEMETAMVMEMVGHVYHQYIAITTVSIHDIDHNQETGLY
jgi:hypothetical protein